MSQAGTEPPRKRQRVTQACHRCRSKKYKCNSERPTCSTCKSSDAECVYATVAKRRGLQSGYVRAIELLWGLVFAKVDGSQHVVNELLASLSKTISNGSGDSDHGANDLLDCWRSSGIPAAIELMLDGEFISNPPAEQWEDMDSQVDLTQAPIQAWSLPPNEQLLQGTPPPPPRASSPALPAAVASDARFPSEDELFATSTPSRFAPLPPDWHSLTQVYLSVEHAWFPILERHALFRVAYVYQDESSDHRAVSEERHRGEYATLWAVLALGEIHSKGVISPRVAQFKSISKSFLSPDPMPDDYLVHGQALLLWSSVHLGCNNLILARSKLAQAFVFSSAIRPERSSDDPMFQRKRALALAGCFVMDTLLSMAMGTRPRITVDDMPSPVPCDESSLDEWEPYVNKFGSQRYLDAPSAGMAAPSRISSTFNDLVKLFCILNAVMQKQTAETDHAAAVETWARNRPRHLTVAESNQKTGLPPQLHLLSFYSIISYIATSKGSHGQPHFFPKSLQQGPVRDIVAPMLRISDEFGVQAMPVSMSVLILFIPSEPTPNTSDCGPPSIEIQDTITKYKAMWGWEHVPAREARDLTGATLIGHSANHLLTSFASQDLLRAPVHSEAQHDLRATTGSRATTGLGAASGLPNDDALAPHIAASRQSDQVGMGLDMAATSYIDEATGFVSDNALADIPAQLGDYLALLQENERYRTLIYHELWLDHGGC